MDESILEALGVCPLFNGMTTGDITAVMTDIAYRTTYLEKGEPCVLSGERLTHLDIIVTGEMTARMMGASGRMVEVIRWQRGGMLTPGFIFASDNTLPVTLEAATEVKLLRLSAGALERLIHADLRIQTNYIRRLSDIVAFLAERLRFLALLTVREKVACAIIAEARAQQSRTIVLRRSRQAIADSFGIQKFSLMRCLADFAAKGAIRVEGRTITILNSDKMK